MPKDDLSCKSIQPPGLVMDTVRQFGVAAKTRKKNTARSILGSHPVGTVLRGEEHAFAALLLDCHPRAMEKKGVGARHFRIDYDSGWRCFSIARTDGTTEKFSMHTALSSPAQASRASVKQAFRAEINDQIAAFRGSLDANVCAECGAGSAGEYHVDHATALDFNVLVDRFCHTFLKDGLPEASKPAGKASDYRFTDRDLADKWADFHKRNAKLQLLCATCNLTKSANPTRLFCG